MHKILNFLVFSLKNCFYNVKSPKSLQVCVQIFCGKYCRVVQLILCQGIFFSYFLDAWFKIISLLKIAHFILNIIKFWYKCTKIPNFFIFHWILMHQVKHPKSQERRVRFSWWAYGWKAQASLYVLRYLSEHIGPLNPQFRAVRLSMNELFKTFK